MPIASIVAGMFVRNPLLKMTLIGFGGANLLNKAGHEKIKQAVEANIADIHYEFGMGISSSENYSDEDWAEFMPYTRWECKLGVIEYAEESLAVLKQYYGKYLPMSEDLGRLLMYIAEQKEEANKMRNADFTKQLQKSMAGKR